MTGWRDRLAAIRARPAAPTDPAPPAAEANDAIGTNDMGMESADTGALADRLAFYTRFQAEAAAALADRDPDPIEAAERAAVFGAEAEPHPYQPGDPDPLRGGLLRGWRAPGK